MKVKSQDSLVYKINQEIASWSGHIILSSDLSHLADKTQVSRALRRLVKEGRLIKIGYGIFAKPMFYSERLNKPIIDFNTAALEALDKLKVEWEIGQAAQDYNAGRSTQVPVKTSIKIKSRFSRKLSYGNMKIQYE